RPARSACAERGRCHPLRDAEELVERRGAGPVRPGRSPPRPRARAGRLADAPVDRLEVRVGLGVVVVRDLAVGGREEVKGHGVLLVQWWELVRDEWMRTN